MTKPSGQPESSETPVSHLPVSTPATVATSSHASHANALAALDTPSKYTQLIAEHAEMIQAGKSSREIISHLGKSLNIEKWEKEEFLGECEFLPTPTVSEVPRLQEYLRALGVDWSLSNGGSDNHSQFFLIDPLAINALVGAENMKKANDLLDKIHADWQATRKSEAQKEEEYAEKEVLLKKYLGLSEIDWKKLIGLRASNGKFEGGGGLRITGSISDNKKTVQRIWVTQDGKRGGSIVEPSPATYSGLFALAQIVQKAE